MNFCKGKISDEMFLKHMIPHHQMALDMANQVLKYSNNPNIISLARDIVWTQTNEILYMKYLLESPTYESPLLRNNPREPVVGYSLLSYYYPKKSIDEKTKGTCDKKFMKPCI